MALEIKLEHEDRSADNYLRTVSFRVGSSTSGRVLPVWDNEVPIPPRLPSWWSPISEMYAALTLGELRHIDGDAIAQERFIKRHFTPISGTVGLPILKLLVAPDDRLRETDYDYLSALIPPPNSLIAVTPLLYGYHITSRGVVRPDFSVDQPRYLEFVRNFVTQVTSGGAKELAIAVPPTVSFTGIGKLLEIYKDISTPFAVIDANGGTNRERYPQLKALVGIGQKDSFNLTEKHGDSFALHGFDCKPFRGRAEVVAAINALQLDNGLSSFGRRRTNRVMIKRKKGVPPPAPKPPMVFYPKEIGYARATVPGVIEELRRWHKGIVAEPLVDSELLKRRRAFEIERLAGVAYQLSEWSSAGELDKQLAKRKVIQGDLKAIKRNNGIIFTPPLG